MRVLLLNPPSPERLGAPLLGLQYVAAALLAAGFEVRVIDAAARGFLHDETWIADQVRQWEPHIVGLPLFTRWVWHAYRLLQRLRGCGALLVAGGAHATVRPREALDQGFDVVLTGEAEHTLVQLAYALRDGTSLAQVPGAWVRQPGGGHVTGPPAAFIENLDALAPPYRAQPLFDAAWYGDAGGTVVPGGIITSRGCPARCTFCANVVTGRGFRSRSAAGVVDELNAWHGIRGATFFPFWDDAFTVHAARLPDLCNALRRGCRFPLGFSAITRAGSVTPALLRQLRDAGLVHVNFGVESGDDEILRAIRKGQRVEQVVQALQWAKDLGLQTACNFMLGFPCGRGFESASFSGSEQLGRW